MKKKMMCVAVSCVMCLINYPCSVAESAVLEPKLVHTERWTTSYYIDDDKDTLYPYIQCVVNIYSNGSVYGWMWNTHEWDGYENIYNDITLIQSIPYCTDSIEYNLATEGTYTNDYSTYTANNKIDIDVSYYPVGYQSNGSSSIGGQYYDTKDIGIKYTEKSRYGDINFSTGIRILTWNGALCKLSYYDTNKSIQTKYGDIYDNTFRFWTNSEKVLAQNNKFRLYGHEFTITPEMLKNETPSRNVESDNTNEELKKYKALYEEALSASKEKDDAISSLNETVEALKSEIESLRANHPVCGDTDDNGKVSIADSVVLNRFLAGTIDTLPCKTPPDDEPEEG